jgi:hypothetical protein
MGKYLCFIVVLFSFTFGFTQEDLGRKKENPIIFIDAVIGFGSGSVDGLVAGYSINYQFNANLLSFRNNYLATKNKSRDKGLSRAFIFPAYIQGNSVNEYALLYGRRLTFDGSSLSLSTGISTNKAIYRDQLNEDIIRSSINYFAVPYEISYKFFKREKSRYRVIYGIIPIGKPTAFSRSIGFKLFGSLGKESYMGLGITIGMGWHKTY